MSAKILDRVEKLLRLAAPSSGSTEPERASAALEAAKLISENDFVVCPREEKPKRHTTRGRSGTAVRVWNPHHRSPPHWIQSVAVSPLVCVDCGGVISFGDNIWIRNGGAAEYVHRIIHS